MPARDTPTEPDALMHIGVVAEHTGLSIRTLRHYDDVGLVPPSERSSGGFRLYTASDVTRLHTIRRMKPLGFTLEQMRELLAAIDTLRDPAVGATAHRAATQAVAGFHQRVQESCERLRRHLAYAEELTTVLSDIEHHPTTDADAEP